jgi:hypothetical protein
MSLYNNFKTDESLEKTGIVLEYGENSEGKIIGIRIARAGGSNKLYASRLEALTKGYRTQIESGAIEKSTVDRIMRQVYADTVVLGWENVEDKDGKPLEFNKDNVIQLFTDLPDLFDDVRSQATKWSLFRKVEQERDAKN